MKRVKCVAPKRDTSLTADHRYTVIKDSGTQYLVMDDTGDYRWYGKWRFEDGA